MELRYDPEEVKKLRAQAVEAGLKREKARSEQIKQRVAEVSGEGKTIKAVQIGSGVLGNGGYVGRFVAPQNLELVMATVAVESTNAIKPQLRIVMKDSVQTVVQDWDVPQQGTLSSPIKIALMENTLLDVFLIDGENKNSVPNGVGVVI